MQQNVIRVTAECRDVTLKNLTITTTDMEDAHTHILSFPGDQDTCFFGVFDGHGGRSDVLSLCFLHLLHMFYRFVKTVWYTIYV